MEDHQMTAKEFQALVRELEATPQIIQQLADELSAGDASWKPSEEEWSVLEYVCHLKDIEQEGYTVRIAKLLNETQPHLTDIDGDQLALTRSYNSQDFETALRAFALARQQNVEAIRDVPLDRLQALSGTFENVGPVTLGKILLMMREHDEGHVQDVRGLHRRLSRKRATLTAAS
jgi:hypothetical protein